MTWTAHWGVKASAALGRLELGGEVLAGKGTRQSTSPTNGLWGGVSQGRPLTMVGVLSGRASPSLAGGTERTGVGGESRGKLRAQRQPNEEAQGMHASPRSMPPHRALSNDRVLCRTREYPYFLVYFKVYGIVLHVQNRDHHSPPHRRGTQPGGCCGPDRVGDSQAS